MKEKKEVKKAVKEKIGIFFYSIICLFSLYMAVYLLSANCPEMFTILYPEACNFFIPTYAIFLYYFFVCLAIFSSIMLIWWGNANKTMLLEKRNRGSFLKVIYWLGFFAVLFFLYKYLSLYLPINTVVADAISEKTNNIILITGICAMFFSLLVGNILYRKTMMAELRKKTELRKKEKEKLHAEREKENIRREKERKKEAEEKAKEKEKIKTVPSVTAKKTKEEKKLEKARKKEEKEKAKQEEAKKIAEAKKAEKEKTEKIKTLEKEVKEIKEVKKPVAVEGERKVVETEIDLLFNLLEQNKKLKLSFVMKELKIDREKTLDLFNILAEHNLAEIHYPAFGDPELWLKSAE